MGEIEWARERNQAGWQSVIAGNLPEALATFNEIFAVRDSQSARLNRGIVYLLIGEVDRAQEDFLATRHHSDHPSLDNCFVGVTFWLNGEIEGACNDWAKMIEEKVDMHAIRLLWWASAHSGCSQWRKLTRQTIKLLLNRKTFYRTVWPRPLISFLGGEIDENILRTIAFHPAPLPTAMRECEIECYLGAVCLAVGDMQNYYSHLKQAVSFAPLPAVPELHLARYELAHAITPKGN